MTQNKAQKTAARERMAETGEPYSVAKRATEKPTTEPKRRVSVRWHFTISSWNVYDAEAWEKADRNTRAARVLAEVTEWLDDETKTWGRGALEPSDVWNLTQYGPGSLEYDIEGDGPFEWLPGDVVFDGSNIGMDEQHKPIPTVSDQPNIDAILDPDYDTEDGTAVGDMAAVIKAIPSLL